MDHVRQAEGLTAEQQQAWSSTVESFGRRYGNADLIVAAPQPKENKVRKDANTDEAPADLTQDDRIRLTAWLNALDQAAVDRVVDGAIWRADDADAFYRQLDQAHKLDSQDATSVTVVPLMQQPQVYLGQKVRVSGRVARSELKTAAGNPFGVLEYWELWIKPDGGGDRPIVLIVPNVTQRIKDVGPDAALSKGPEVRVVGRFFKRLAYGSSFGADAAPVVVGRLMNQRRAARTLVAATEPGSIPANLRFPLTIAAALLVGISFAALVMWRTAVLGKRSRKVRSSNRPSPDGFLNSLADHEPSEKTIVK